MSRPIWPSVPSGFVRAVLAGHSALGLAFAALIFLVCFSGTAAVFIHEATRWERAGDPVVHTVTPAALQRGFEEGLKATPDADRVVLNLPSDDLPRYVMSTWVKDDSRMWVMDADGRPVARLVEPWTDFVQDLHIYLHLPHTWGLFVVGMVGVALLSSLVSGLLAHPRVFRDAFHLRWGGSKRLQEADLHNRIGVWALPFHVTLSLTGALLGLSTVIVGVLAMVVFKGDTGKAYALFATPEPPASTAPAAPANLAAISAALAARLPDARTTFVFVEDPRLAQQHISFGVETPGRLSRVIYSYDHTGALLGGTGYGDRNLGEGLFSAIGPVHFGWFGGWASKIAYGLLGVGLCVVTSSGVAIWLARRRARGQPAPRWERIWTAAVWSQPVAYGATMLGVVAANLPTVPVWGATTLAALATAAALGPAAISRVLRAAAAATLLAAGVAHVTVWRGQPVDPAAWGMDVALVALAVGLLTPETWRFFARPAPAPRLDDGRAIPGE
ncbi:PepSY domain-containing protein [Phenylobacterium sp.]|uniref:PepSY-associated TM helix domain-containing protein n=1 Tax=Phenylobacterium sp. TaxID=1871053 RepID=UPI0025EB4122|nr:PepSY-associated TM helix domain-containing protein [Phenylobacterium sp.]MBX3484967.1 PepSY domain-containing protein [Phenylobacterium sp.]